MSAKKLLQLAIPHALRRSKKQLTLLGYAIFLIATSASGQTTVESTAVAKEAAAEKAELKATTKEKAEEPEEVVVVGSRIRRTTFDTPSPIKVVTREEATTAGFNSTTDLLQSSGITSGGSQINNAYGGYVTDGGPGANTVSLRGLGASRTLIMINGRRVAPSGTRGAVGSADLNVLPNSIIERVEVLRDGASSVYGSDAIGGVINVITMNKVEGINLEAEFNKPIESGGEQSRFSITAGASDDRWSLSGSFDYYDRADLTFADRDITKCSADGYRDPTTGETMDFIDPKTNKPKCYPVTGTGSPGVTVNTIGTQLITPDNYADYGLTAPPVGALGATVPKFSRFRANPAVTTGIVGYEGVGGGGNDLNLRDTFDPRMMNENLISPVKVYTSFIQGEYDLQALGDAKAYFELLATRRKSEQTGFRQLSMDYRLNSPLIPAELGFADFAPDQGTSDGEDVGVRAFIGFGNDHSKQTVDFYKPTFGIKGDLTFIDGWKYDVYTSYSKSDATYNTQSFLTDKLTFASDAVAKSGGGFDCAINATNPNEHCVPFPALNPATVAGNLPQDFKDYIFRDVQGTTKYDEALFSAVFDGPLFAVPAGKVQGVLGLEHRREKIDDEPDENSINGNLYNLSSAAPTKGKDNVSEIYTEIEVPILSKIDFARELTLNGSYRYTDYDSYGSDTTYKIGLVYAPTKWLSFRGTKGTSFRAPALFEQFQGATSGFLSSANDPCNDYGKKSATIAANCETEIPNNPTFTATNGIQTLNVGGAESGLYAETSENVTYGVIFEPSIGDSTELSFALDYFDIDISNGVKQAGADEILTRCYNSPGFHAAGGLCRLVTRNPTDNQLLVSDAYTNLSTEKTRGIDFDARWQQDIGSGQLLLNLSTTHYLSQASKIFKADELQEENGWLGTPEWSGTTDISYKLNNWRVTYGVEWIGAMNGYKYAGEDEATSQYDFAVGDYYKHRISIGYSADTWEATFGVRNFTNAKPPTISSGVYDRVGNTLLYSAYDLVGREAFLSVQYHFQ